MLPIWWFWLNSLKSYLAHNNCGWFCAFSVPMTLKLRQCHQVLNLTETFNRSISGANMVTVAQFSDEISHTHKNCGWFFRFSVPMTLKIGQGDCISKLTEIFSRCICVANMVTLAKFCKELSLVQELLLILSFFCFHGLETRSRSLIINLDWDL